MNYDEDFEDFLRSDSYSFRVSAPSALFLSSTESGVVQVPGEQHVQHSDDPVPDSAGGSALFSFKQIRTIGISVNIH